MAAKTGAAGRTQRPTGHTAPGTAGNGRARATVRQTLDRALRNYGLPGLNEEETLAAALSRTRTAIDQARQTVAARAALSARIVEQETDLRAVVAKRAVLAERRADWQAQWNVAVAALRLSQGAASGGADRLDPVGSARPDPGYPGHPDPRSLPGTGHALQFRAGAGRTGRTVAEPLTGEAADRIAVACMARYARRAMRTAAANDSMPISNRSSAGSARRKPPPPSSAMSWLSRPAAPV